MSDLNFRNMDFGIVVVGMMRSEPSEQILVNCENAVKSHVARKLQTERDNVYVRARSGKPDEDQLQELGSKTIHVQQYDIGVEDCEYIDDEFLADTTVEKLADLGFDTTGTISRKIEDKPFVL